MFRFANPEYLHLLWLVLGVFVLGYMTKQYRRRQWQKYFKQSNVDVLTKGFSPGRRQLKLSLQLSVMVFCILALARPQLGKGEQKVKSKGIEVVVAVDVSNSMLAEDLRPSRLEAVKREVARFLDLLGGDRVGLIAFAGSAVVLSPLTPDKSALKMFLEGLNTETVANQGTNFGRALRAALELFQNGGLGGEEDLQITRAMVLISDGEDHEGGFEDVAKELSEAGIRIFSISVGTDEGAPIPVRDDQGNLRGYKSGPDGQTLLSRSSGEGLRKLSEIGRGQFFHLVFGGNQMVQLRDGLSRLEQAEFDSQMSIAYDEKYQWFLLLAFILAIIEIVLPENLRGSRKWRGRFEVAP